ncbi:hypothetical protein E2C01_000897 [Portunus trituberculatus]|uniref:Uncharacterized protein n=1 Tax=Portunus trituberculatus TaxID=210409 RepID=A0A5B7CIV2_PORTR|nr:hypothetical protein [Portunus trituberculatus]
MKAESRLVSSVSGWFVARTKVQRSREEAENVFRSSDEKTSEHYRNLLDNTLENHNISNNFPCSVTSTRGEMQECFPANTANLLSLMQ